ncbi:MAG: 2-amino-4-hydroxy-6-hydroxymethyldihydropteridine diphosphokinase [Gaiellales bacterium]|nr:2-amino-4-hydroxy-6-hydroxymethyldihydropteridine diphosphokinase [Gaiellales bacterium]
MAICEDFVKGLSASPPFRVTRAYVGLGSNLGDPAATLRTAAVRLRSLGQIAGVSQLYETEPVGLEDQPPFRNAVVALDTDLQPLALLDGLQAIEAEFGRERTIRWGPRTLDLDVIWYDGAVLESERLTLPHPRAHEREFVLRPLSEVAPELPLAGSTVRELLADLAPQGVRSTGEPLIQ